MARTPNRQDGLSLVELLVSVAVLTVAATIALTLYDSARRTFKRGENSTEQQQTVRVAFDLLVSELRMAGFNTNPDGNKSRPDEQVEAAYATAVVIRADFDASDPVASIDPEATLGGPGSAFLTVSTGNDEIRGFVLAKEVDGGPDSVTFQADVQSPGSPTVRDGVVEDVVIDEVTLSQDDPPYNLYRVSLDEAGDPVRTVMAENIRSLRFRYFDQSGIEVPAVGGAETESAIRARASIRRIRVEVEGLTRDPDLQWLDPRDDDPATRRLRKFGLEGDVTPRNLGRAGIRDYLADVVAPSAPTSAPALYPGHCGGLNVDWSPNPPEDETAYYRVLYGSDSMQLNLQRSTSRTRCFIGSLVGEGARYYVAIQAVDAAGNRSPLSPLASVVTDDFTTPESVEGLVASDGLAGRIELSWPAVETNTTSTNGDPYPLLLRDLAGYRVYRGTAPGFTVDDLHRIADADVVGPLTSPTFVDQTALNCQNQYYRVAAIDTCGKEGEPSLEAVGRSSSDYDPKVPTTVEVFWESSSTLRVEWDAVHENVQDQPTTVSHYNIFRTGKLPLTPLPGDASFTLIGTADGGTTSYLDNWTLQPGETSWYRVSAVDCARESARSAIARPLCSFTGDLTITSPNFGAQIDGSANVVVQVLNASTSATFAALHLQFNHTEQTFTRSVDLLGSGPSWSYVWDTASFPAGTYQIRAVVDRFPPPAYVCPNAATITVHVGSP